MWRRIVALVVAGCGGSGSPWLTGDGADVGEDAADETPAEGDAAPDVADLDETADLGETDESPCFRWGDAGEDAVPPCPTDYYLPGDRVREVIAREVDWRAVLRIPGGFALVRRGHDGQVLVDFAPPEFDSISPGFALEGLPATTPGGQFPGWTFLIGYSRAIDRILILGDAGVAGTYGALYDLTGRQTVGVFLVAAWLYESERPVWGGYWAPFATCEGFAMVLCHLEAPDLYRCAMYRVDGAGAVTVSPSVPPIVMRSPRACSLPSAARSDPVDGIVLFDYEHAVRPDRATLASMGLDGAADGPYPVPDSGIPDGFITGCIVVPGTAEVVVVYVQAPEGGRGLYREFIGRVDRQGRVVEPFRMIVDFGVGLTFASSPKLDLEGNDRYALIVEDDRLAREPPGGGGDSYYWQRFLRVDRDGTVLQETLLSGGPWWQYQGWVSWQGGFFVGVWDNARRMGSFVCSPNPW